ncbi:MAG: hypothetical protein HY744_01655 [Deltaproteobacteria bacterium]|nr:hypothetical protein [Deltaproteobacteria bacterium]
MSAFDLHASLVEAERRLARVRDRPRRRSDAGVSRIDPLAQQKLRDLLSGFERRPTRQILADLQGFCRSAGCRMPARATVYQLIKNVGTPQHRAGDLPPAVRDALYNVEDDTMVPEAQIAFYCFNYGDLAAMSFAAGLPWLALHQASRMRGWRHKSRGPLDAVLRARGM